MIPNWSVKKCIEERAKKESDFEWGNSETKIELPPFKKCDIIKNNAGWYNLIANALRESLNELRP